MGFIEKRDSQLAKEVSLEINIKSVDFWSGLINSSEPLTPTEYRVFSIGSDEVIIKGNTYKKIRDVTEEDKTNSTIIRCLTYRDRNYPSESPNPNPNL